MNNNIENKMNEKKHTEKFPKRHLGELNWSILSEKRGILMGFAALWVVAFHGTSLFADVSIPIITQILKRGNIGVEMFLIASAIGLYFSMENGCGIKRFYINRIKRVVIPYLVLSSWYWIWRTIVNGNSIVSFFKNWSLISYVTDGVLTSWYVFFILCMYLLFPLIYMIVKKERNLIFIIIVIDMIINVLVWILWPEVYDYLEIALTRVPAFLFSCWLAPMVKEYKKIKRNTYIFDILGIVFGVLLILLFFATGQKDLAVMVYRYTSIFIALFLCIALAAISNSKRMICKALTGVGGVSLEVYLLSIFVNNILAEYSIAASGNLLVKTITYTMTSSGVVLLSLVLKRLSKCNLRTAEKN